MESVDLVVVGAGPAGAAAAIRFLQLRPAAHVVVLDKAKFPRDKPCGDGLGPDAVGELVTLGASSILVGRVPVTRVRLTSPSGRSVVGAPPRPGFVIPRLELDAGLVDVAQQFGADVRHERVESITNDGTHAVVNDIYRSPVLVAADGANSRTRTLLGERRAPDNHAAFAVRGYANSPSDELEIRWERNLFPAYSWLFPIGDGRVNIGFGCLHDRLKGDRPKEHIWQALAESVTLEPLPGTLRAHRLPFTSARLSRSRGRVLFAGDAAGMINPLSGEGIYYALATGRMAGAAAALASEKPADTYEHAVRRLFARHFQATNLAHRLQRLPRNIDASIAAAESSFEVFEDLVELALGRGGITAAMLRGVARNWVTGS